MVILLFESNENQRVLYEMKLVDAGYEVLVVGDVNEAAALVLDGQLDLAVVGLHLGGDVDVVVLKALAGFDVPEVVFSALPPDPVLRPFVQGWVLKQSDLGPLLGEIQRVSKLLVA